MADLLKASLSYLNSSMIYVCLLLPILHSVLCDQCPQASGGVPSFFDAIEERCSTCTVGVCATQTPSPPECLCFCIKEHASVYYTEIQKRACREPEKNVTDGQSGNEGNHGAARPDLTIWIVVVLVAVIIIALTAILVVFKRRERDADIESLEPEQQKLRPTPVGNVNNNEKETVAYSEVYLTSLLNASAPGESVPQTGPTQNVHIIMQETIKDRDTDETTGKEIASDSSEDNDLLGVEESGPSDPSRKVVN